jgi:serine/threonine protein kinase/formylglycine-generating enzyme required for sulfatase activity
MPDLTGQSLERYHIIEQLGEGGMAVVYKAFDATLEREVAVKIIRPEKVTSEKFIRRFSREAKALAKLSHENIIPIIDFGEHDTLPYLVMPFLPGGTLKKILGKPIPYESAASILAPIANALAYAHSLGIIHRDIKPSNILLTETGKPMLSDFGVAKILEMEETAELTDTGVGVGTPEYMSPEQTLGKPVDGRTDCYALGIVLYEMITGRKPFQADTPLAIAIKQSTEPLPNPRIFVPLLPEKVEHVLIKALAKNPDHRYQSLELFEKALRELALGDLPQPKKPYVPKTKPSMGRKLGWAGGIAAIGLIAAFILLSNLNQDNAKTPIPALSSSMTNTAVQITPPISTQTLSIPTATKEQVVNISTPEFLTNSLITYTQDFSSYSPSEWGLSTSSSIRNNVLKLTGNNFTAGITLDNRLHDQEGILLGFKCAPDTFAEIFLQTGTWLANGMRRWGIYCVSDSSNLIEPDLYQDNGVNIEGEFIGDLTIEPDTWYALLLTIGGTGEFTARVWTPENPEDYYELKKVMGPGWENKSWHLGIGADTGSIEITNYQELDLRSSLYKPTSTPTLKPSLDTLDIGSSMITEDGMEMVFVPAGEFLMGSIEGLGNSDEYPQHTVFLNAYWIDKTEVTNAMYMQCITEGGCIRGQRYYHLDRLEDPKYSNHPVVNINHAEADEYCNWVGKRLPTEAEWEKAGRGANNSLYPWGSVIPNGSLANFNKNIGGTIKVGSYPDGVSPYGALDMAGNVWEWVSDKYLSSYYSFSPAENPKGPTDKNLAQYVLRGGSFKSNQSTILTTTRGMYIDDAREDIGFRCAMDAD